MTDLLLLLIAAELVTLLLLGIAALLMLRNYAERALDRLADASDEHLPAIRSAVSDVVNHLIPPGGAR